MIDYQTKQDLKTYLIERQNRVHEWDLGKSHDFCVSNNVDFQSLMQKAIAWQQEYGDVDTNLTDKQFPYTIL